LHYGGKAQILRSSSIFYSLNDDELSELAELSIERSFMSNEFIFWDGDAPEWFYIIAEGKVKVLKHSSLGKEFIIAFFGPSEMFGEVAVFENKPYPASAQAVIETKVVGIKTDEFLSFLANCPQVALKIINVLAGLLRAASETLPERELSSVWPAYCSCFQQSLALASPLPDRKSLTWRGPLPRRQSGL